MTIKRVLESCLYVDDLAAAENFYTSVLGLSLLSKQDDRHLFFKLSDQMLLLFKAESTLAEDVLPKHGTSGPGHIAFEVSEDELANWKESLIDKGVTIEHEHQWPNGVKSFYFRDPAGNSLELATASIWGL